MDFAITCLNFAYSIFICAFILLIKILVMDFLNNQIMHSSGIMVIIIYSLSIQSLSDLVYSVMAHSVWPSLQKIKFGILAIIFLYIQEYSIIVSCFSEVPTVSLESRAKSRMLAGRKRTTEEEDRFLIRQELNPAWGKGRTLDKKLLIQALSGPSTDNESEMGSDTKSMGKFLRRVNPTLLQVPSIAPETSFIPELAPLLDYLVVHTKARDDNWSLPRLGYLEKLQQDRGLSLSMLNNCEVREIVVGQTSGIEIETIIWWMLDQMEKNEISLPCSGLALDIITQRISLRDMYRMAGKIPILDGEQLVADELELNLIPSLPIDEWRDIPVKILMGDGVNWLTVITVNVGTPGRPWLKPTNIQPELIRLITGTPAVVGFDMKRKCQLVEDMFTIISGSSVQMRGFVDLESLSVLAGWKLSARGPTAMGVQVLGALIHTDALKGDGRWGMPWKHASKALQVCAMGNIKIIHAAVNILMGVLIRDVFPDPDVLCYHLKYYQYDAAVWFCELVMISLQNTEVNHAEARAASTREELVCSIRSRAENGSLSSEISSLINMWDELLGTWPSVTNGGCRYLLQARDHFIHQCASLRAAGVTSKNKEVKQMNEDDMLYILFGMNRFRLRDVDWEYPLSSDKFGLLRMEGLQDRTLDFDPVRTTDHMIIVEMCSSRRLSQRGAILEWARMNPGLIPDFLNTMKNNPKFCSWFKSYYDTLRFMYIRLVREDPPCIQRLEHELEENYVRQAKIERTKYQVSLKETEERALRVAWFDEGDSHKSMLDRGRLLHRLPQLSVTKVTKRRRSTSRSAARGVVRRFRHPEPRVECATQVLGSNRDFSASHRVIEVDESGRDYGSRDPESGSMPSGSSRGLGSTPGEQPGSSKEMGLIAEDDVEAQLNKDSSDDDSIELYVPPELMNSLLE